MAWFTIYRSNLKAKLDIDEYVVADVGYRDDSVILPSELTIQEGINLHNRVRTRHETLNSRLKNFSVLKETFRHDLDFQSNWFFTVLDLTQLSLDENPQFLIHN